MLTEYLNYMVFKMTTLHIQTVNSRRCNPAKAIANSPVLFTRWQCIYRLFLYGATV